MSISLTVTVGTTDYSFDWIEQVISIESGVENVIAVDLKKAIGDAQDDTQGMSFSPISKNANPVVLTLTTSTFLTIILEDQWRIDSLSSSGLLTIEGGNVVNVNNGIDIFAPNPAVHFVNNTSAAGVSVQSAGGITEQDKIDIIDNLMARVMENGESFAEAMRLIRAEAAGDIVKTGTLHEILAADGAQKRIIATADENGRDVTSVDGS